MLAIVQSSSDKKLVLQSVPKPEPKDREVLIKVNYSSLNRMDLLQAAGKYPVPPGASPILGVEVSGYISFLSPGCQRSDLKVGMPVAALLQGGGYASFATVDERTVIPFPSSPAVASLLTLAAVPEAFMTAYQLLFLVGELKEGQTVLLHAGASSIGQAACQLAVRAGLTVVATVRDGGKHGVLTNLGCSAVVTPGEGGKFADEIRKALQGQGVDAVLDCVGGNYMDDNLEVLNLDGKIVLYGLMGGPYEGNLLPRLMSKRASIRSSTLRSRDVAYKEELIRRIMSDPKDAGFPSERNGIVVNVDRTFPLGEAQMAHEYMAANKNAGKIVLVVNEEEGL